MALYPSGLSILVGGSYRLAQPRSNDPRHRDQAHAQQRESCDTVVEQLSISVQYFPLISVQLFPLYRFAEGDFCDA